MADDQLTPIEPLSDRLLGSLGWPSSADEMAVLSRAQVEQGESVWVKAVSPTRRNDSANNNARPVSEWRWRYPNLDELIARPAGQRPRLRRHLKSKDTIVATNAAIMLGREGDTRAADVLFEAVRSPAMNLPMRCAAAEALGALPMDDAVGRLNDLLDQYGNDSTGAPFSTPYYDRLHTELIRGLARHVSPDRNGHFGYSLRSRSAMVRLGAAEAWAAWQASQLSQQVVDLRSDEDVDIRILVLQMVASRRLPQTIDYLEAGLRDYSPQVRYAAIRALGEFGGPEAEAHLQRLVRDGNKMVRAAAVQGLVLMDAKKDVLDAADDKAWEVRVEVGKSLVRYADREGVAIAKQFLSDETCVKVSRATIASLSQWPVERAGPLLLEAMGNSAYVNRESAKEQLVAIWPAAAGFQTGAPLQQRQDSLEALRAQFVREFGSNDSLALAFTNQLKTPPVTADEVEEVWALLDRQDISRLLSYGPRLSNVLEHILLEEKKVLPSWVYRDVLSQRDSACELLDQMITNDLSLRRRALTSLATLAEKEPLSPLAVARLYELVVTDGEADTTLWRDSLRAVANSPSQQAVHLAYAAMGHEDTDVRRRACNHLASHPAPRHIPTLVAALDDSSPLPRIAAIRALGEVGQWDNPEPLRRLLGSTNEQTRLEATLALIRLGDPQGQPSLQRLSYSDDPIVRRRVAEIMGELADPALVPTLVRLLDCSASERAAMESLHRIVGKDISLGADHVHPDAAERKRRWKRWYQKQYAQMAAN